MNNIISIEEEYNLYDQIISTTYANIFSFSKDSSIILKDFLYESSMSRVFLEVSCMVAYMTNKEIYLQTSLFNFLRARLKKKNKHIHWIRRHKKNINGIDIYAIAAYEAVAFNQDETIFDDIFKAYYERKEA